ncbi:MAG: IclR family transcriptional regulator [Armatimonadota bacterium]|nr:IclR family transcriptional regulator [Armatimonadota bacterium]
MSGPIQSADRALRILQVVADHRQPLSLLEVSQLVGLHASTTYRLLATLRDRGFVEQESAGGRYRVGIQAFRVGSAFLAAADLRDRLRPVLATLAAHSRETANLVILHETEAVYIDHIVGVNIAKLFTQIGQRVPLHCTAVGKVLLAYAPDPEGLLRRLRLRRFTPYTMTTATALRRALATVRAAGCAVDREEHELGVACGAGPVWDAAGRVVAAVGISGPSARVLPRLAQMQRHVRAAATAASRLMGASAAVARPGGAEALGEGGGQDGRQMTRRHPHG